MSPATETFESYLQSPALNWSRLKLMAKSPAHYQWALTEPREDTDALLAGRAVHTAVLEPKLFPQRFATFTGERRAGKVWEEFEAANIGRDLLTMKQAMMVSNIATSIRRHPEAVKWLSLGAAEQSFYFTVKTPSVGDFPPSEWPAKARIDYLGARGIVDLKTAADGSRDGFARAAWRLGYLGQAAWYVDAVQAVTGRECPFTFIVVEKTAPYVVSVLQVPDDLIDVGRDHYRGLLAHLALCERTNHWPGYVDGVGVLELPSWVRLEDEDVSADELDLNHNEEVSHGL